tara:strand:- start:559 stop:1158 length:600 start_codon:yes stop_codon:yes gene_type:complete
MSEIKKIIDEAILRITKLNNNNPDIEDVLSKAELLSEQLESISGEVLKDVEKLEIPEIDIQTPSHCMSVIDKELAKLTMGKTDELLDQKLFVTDEPDTHYGSKGTLVDPATYWWRGLPVKLELSWIGGSFFCKIIRVNDNAVVANYDINFWQMLRYIERDNQKCMDSLGSDYGHMFGVRVDHNDACNNTSWHWTDEKSQ